MEEDSPARYASFTYTDFLRKEESEIPWWDHEYDFVGNTSIRCTKAVNTICMVDWFCLYFHWEVHTNDVLSMSLIWGKGLTLCSNDSGTTMELVNMQVFV